MENILSMVARTKGPNDPKLIQIGVFLVSLNFHVVDV